VLTHLALDVGFDIFVLMGQPAPELLLRTFIDDVAPQVRESVASARGGHSLQNRRPTRSPVRGERRG
jgi:hypothetical protein